MHIYKHKYVPIYLRICMDRGMARCEWADGGWERELGEGVGKGGGERGECSDKRSPLLSFIIKD